MITPLTGGASVFGIAARNGAQLAFTQVNEEGGLLDLPVNFIYLDDIVVPIYIYIYIYSEYELVKMLRKYRCVRLKSVIVF
jgi:hypothetical protein